jgi:hypothetical protein
MGYGLLGFAQGLQSGMGMGMQFKNMQWQNEERKKIEQKKKDTQDALSNFFGSSYGQTMMTGGNLSPDDKTMFMTALQGATAEARGIMGSVHQAWQQGDKETYNREMDRLNILLEFYGSNNKFDTSNMEAAFNGLEQTFTHPDAINACTAGRNILASRHQPLDTQRLDIAVKGTGVGTEASLAETNALLGTDYKVEDTSEEAIKVIQNARITLDNAAMLGKSSFNTIVNNMKLEEKYKNVGIDFENISFEKWTAPTSPKPSKPSDLKEVSTSIQAIRDAGSPEDAQVLANAYITEHGSLQDLGIKGEDVGEYWGENQKWILENITKDLSTLVNEKGFVEPELMTERTLIGPKQTKKNSEWYKILFDEYMTLWEEMESLGVDMTNIPKMYKIEDIKKITALTWSRGTKQGDWRAEGWWKTD